MELSSCTPMVFWWQWPKEIKCDIVMHNNLEGSITNSDLELAGILLLWLAMEEVCRPLWGKQVTLFNDNSHQLVGSLALPPKDCWWQNI